jgi:hypothetical protein
MTTPASTSVPSTRLTKAGSFAGVALSEVCEALLKLHDFPNSKKAQHLQPTLLSTHP